MAVVGRGVRGRWGIVGVALVVGLVAGACGDDEPAAGPAPPGTSPVTEVDASTAVEVPWTGSVDGDVSVPLVVARRAVFEVPATADDCQTGIYDYGGLEDPATGEWVPDYGDPTPETSLQRVVDHAMGGPLPAVGWHRLSISSTVPSRSRSPSTAAMSSRSCTWVRRWGASASPR